MTRRVLILLVLLILISILIWIVWQAISRNNPPVATNGAVFTVVNEPVNGRIVASDPDDSDVLTLNLTPVTQPTKGNVVLINNFTFEYTPFNGSTGSDLFVFQVCDPAPACAQGTMTITFGDPVNAENDGFTTSKNSLLAGNVLTNDSPINQITAVAAQAGDQTTGLVNIAPDGSLSYQPAADYVGSFVINYQACHTQKASSCDSADIAITVTELSSNNDPSLQPDQFSAVRNQQLAGNVLSNDSDPNGLALSVATDSIAQPSNGILVINANGEFTYDINPAAPNDVTSDQFSYTACNASNLCSSAEVQIAFLQVDPIDPVDPVNPEDPNQGNITPGSNVAHEIQNGEWLRQIARCYGSTVDAIREENSIANPNLIEYPGIVITIPNVGSDGPITGPPCIQTYTVKTGDSSASIAQAYGIRSAELERINSVRGFGVGQTIVIPLPIPDYMK